MAEKFFDDLDYFALAPPIHQRGDESKTTVTHAYDGLEVCTNPCSDDDEIRVVVNKTTHQIRIPKESETYL